MAGDRNGWITMADSLLKQSNALREMARDARTLGEYMRHLDCAARVVSDPADTKPADDWQPYDYQGNRVWLRWNASEGSYDAVHAETREAADAGFDLVTGLRYSELVVKATMVPVAPISQRHMK